MIIFGNKDLNQLDNSDINGLISRQEMESIILEFKKEPTSDSKEIAKDVSAMANSEGGIIIYGIEEDQTGKANSINWINASDNFPERFEEVITSTINPCVNCRLSVIKDPSDDSKEVYIVFIPKSTKLHMVIKNKDYRYYNRLDRTIQRIEHSEIETRLRIIWEQEKSFNNILQNLNDDFYNYSTEENNETNYRINYFLIPEFLNHKATTTMNTNRANEIRNAYPPCSGNISNTYKGNIVISNREQGDSEFWSNIIIIHQTGILEYRKKRTDDSFASIFEMKKIVSFINWALKYYEKIGYHGGLNLMVEINNVSIYHFCSTFNNSRGIYTNQGQKIEEKVYIDPILVLTEEKIKQKIIDFLQQISAYLGVTGLGALNEIQEIINNNPLDNIPNIY
jgi:hypothetical protein